MELTLKKSLLLLLPSLQSAGAETVLGAYIFHRHGDRTTKSYSPVKLTALGAEQVFASGSYYRDLYVSSDASSRIHDLATDVAVLSQLAITSPFDAVLQNSAQVFLQGLYPPAGTASAETLANGTAVESPLGGYQYIPVNPVSTAASSGGSEESEWLQGNSGCGNAIVSSNNYFTSDHFTSGLESTKAFYQSLLPVIQDTFDESKANFKNAYTIYDLIHVSEIHNKTIPSSNLLTDATLHQLQTRADQQQWDLAYNSTDEIRAIAGAVLAGQILQALNGTLHATKASAQRLTIQFGAYGTFMSFFGLADAPAASPDFYGIVDYASSMIFELVTNATVADSKAVDSSDVSVRFRFANGSANADANPLREFALFGQKETVLPWSDFAAGMQRFAIADTAHWCSACGNTTGVCSAEALGTDGGDGDGDANASGSNGGGSGGVSKPVAGVIGALVTLVVILGIEALVMGVGGLRLVKKGSSSKSDGSPSVAQA